MTTAPADSIFDLTGKVAIVTGGSRGLGREMVLAFARHGADVVIASRKLEGCEALADEVRTETGRTALAVACHVGDWDQVGALAERAYDEFGKVDVLVNNAGMSPLYPSLADVTEALYDKVLDVNLKGPFRLTALVGTRMAEGDGGSIINVSSTAAERPTPTELPYAGAKAALNAFTIGFAARLRPEGPGELHPARAVPDRHRQGLGHGDVREDGPDEHRPRAWRAARRGGRRCALLRLRRVELHHRRDPAGRRRRALTLECRAGQPAHRASARWRRGRRPWLPASGR